LSCSNGFRAARAALFPGRHKSYNQPEF
jgi:hypothetical protein